MLTLIRSIALPPHPAGGFDHGDAYLHSGRVFVAHTAAFDRTRQLLYVFLPKSRRAAVYGEV